MPWNYVRQAIGLTKNTLSRIIYVKFWLQIKLNIREKNLDSLL